MVIYLPWGGADSVTNSSLPLPPILPHHHVVVVVVVVDDHCVDTETVKTANSCTGSIGDAPT